MLNFVFDLLCCFIFFYALDNFLKRQNIELYIHSFTSLTQKCMKLNL